MEIHHQHHHDHPEHKEKLWKHYALEFFMLFLAVFCGFIAENYRESLTNAGKEKHFAASLADDLKKDTAELNYVISMQKVLIVKMDNALNIPMEQLKEEPMQRQFYKNFIYFYSWVPIFIRDESTITQLKSGGGLNIFRSQSLIDSISKLDNFYDVIKYNNDWYVKECDNTDNTASQFIITWKIPSEFSDSTISEIPANVLLFDNYDSRLITQLYNYIKLEQSMIDLLISMEIVYKAKSVTLLNGLKKDYSLE